MNKNENINYHPFFHIEKLISSLNNKFFNWNYYDKNWIPIQEKKILT